MIARIGVKHRSTVINYLVGTIRIISARRSRPGSVALYGVWKLDSDFDSHKDVAAALVLSKEHRPLQELKRVIVDSLPWMIQSLDRAACPRFCMTDAPVAIRSAAEPLRGRGAIRSSAAPAPFFPVR